LFSNTAKVTAEKKDLFILCARQRCSSHQFQTVEMYDDLFASFIFPTIYKNII